MARAMLAVRAVPVRSTTPRPEQPVEALRRRLARAGAGAREQVVLDFLDDDLGEARAALAEVAAYLAAVDGALRDARAGRQQLLTLAVRDGPPACVAQLETALVGLQRRLARAAVRLPR